MDEGASRRGASQSGQPNPSDVKSKELEQNLAEVQIDHSQNIARFLQGFKLSDPESVISSVNKRLGTTLAKTAAITNRLFPIALDIKSGAIQITSDATGFDKTILFQEIIAYSIHFKLKPEKYAGSADLYKEDAASAAFFQGYISELRSDGPVAHIKYKKDKPFLNGRACARYELLMTSASLKKIQKEITNIPTDICGFGKERPILQRMVAANFREEAREEALTFFKNLARLKRTRKVLCFCEVRARNCPFLHRLECSSGQYETYCHRCD
jgi:hypothetical protein